MRGFGGHILYLSMARTEPAPKKTSHMSPELPGSLLPVPYVPAATLADEPPVAPRAVPSRARHANGAYANHGNTRRFNNVPLSLRHGGFVWPMRFCVIRRQLFAVRTSFRFGLWRARVSAVQQYGLSSIPFSSEPWAFSPRGLLWCAAF